MNELVIDDRGAVRVLTMNRPEKHNALNTALTQSLLDALLAADRDPVVRAVVLTGQGKSFCAGADTTEFSTLVPEDPTAVQDRAELTSQLHRVFSRMSKPVVAAVRGNALGGGAGLAIACDLTVMADTVRFGYPELKHGIVAAVVMSNLVRQLGRKHAFELLSMGEPINGTRAFELGLANRVTEDGQVLELALEMADKLAGWSQTAMGTSKRLFHRVAELTLEEGLDAGRDINVIMRGFKKAGK